MQILVRLVQSVFYSREHFSCTLGGNVLLVILSSVHFMNMCFIRGLDHTKKSNGESLSEREFLI